MKRIVGETYTILNEEYKLIEDKIVKRKDKLPFLKKMVWMSIVFIVIGFIVTFLLFWGNATVTFDLLTVVLYLIAYLLFVVVHELLHGITFVLFSKNPWNTMKFGLSLKSGVAYCISLVPVKIPRARWSLMMPLYVVCIPLYVYAIVAADLGLALYAVLLASGSVGDIYYMWQLKGLNNDLYMFEELPNNSGYEIGFYVFEKIKSV